MKPSDPRFSCGPTRKFAKWSPSHLKTALNGRYHRSDSAKTLLADVYSMMREALNVPSDYQLLTLPGSCTGAMTSIMANVLGERPVQAYSQGVFGRTWAKDAETYCEEITEYHAFCDMPDVSKYQDECDILLVLNETSVGAKLNNLDWISPKRSGLTICDITSAAFVNSIDWSKTDIAVWSWQKALASEAGFATVAVSPSAAERILKQTRALPKFFTLRNKNGNLVEMINTLSLLALQDVHFSLTYYLKQGGQKTYFASSRRKRAFVNQWLDGDERFDDFVTSKLCRSDTVVYVKVNDEERIPNMLVTLAEKDIALDIASHRLTPTGIRFWIGPSVPYDDIVALSKWLKIVY